MTNSLQQAGQAPAGGSDSSLADVVDIVLDKGVVIDAHVNVGVVGIQLLTVDARVVIASVDTYLRFAEAVNRLDLSEQEGTGVPEIVEGGTKGKALGKAAEVLDEIGSGVSDRREKAR